MHTATIIPNFANRSIVCPSVGYGGPNYCNPGVCGRDLHAIVNWVPSSTGCCSTRRIPTYRVRAVEEEKLNPIQGKPKETDCASSDHWSDNINEETSHITTSFDWGWLLAFPHVLVASISNFLFGYHIGVMNGPIISIAHELGFEGDQLMEGLVVSIFVVSAFFGSFGSSILADRIGRRRTLQLDTLPLIFGAFISHFRPSHEVRRVSYLVHFSILNWRESKLKHASRFMRQLCSSNGLGGIYKLTTAQTRDPFSSSSLESYPNILQSQMVVG